MTGNYTNNFITKVNSEGQLLWKKVFASEGPLQHISSLTIDFSNNIWATMRYFVSLVFDDVSLPGGMPSASGIRSDAALIQMDSDGGVLQFHIANSAASESFSRVQVLSGNQLFVSGSASFDDGDSLQFLNMTLYDWENHTGPDFYFIFDLPLVSTEAPPDRQNEVILMPNPVRKGGLLQVRTEGALQGGLVLLYDNLGCTIWSGRIPDGTQQFPLPAPSQTGMYYLSIQTNNQRVTKKMVVTE